MKRMRVLFAAEAVSLAHVARPTLLAQSLDPASFEVVFASSGEFPICASLPEWLLRPIHSIAPAEFMRRLASGSPVYTESELSSYVASDIAMLEELRPDAVVADFRLSMSIAARKVGVPLFSVCNAYWSPYAADRKMLAPDLAAARYLGFPLLDAFFRASWPLASRYHCRPMNAVRLAYGLGPVQSIREYYCDGDFVLYADTPTLVPTSGAPKSHRYVGPIVWSPQMDLPAWWGDATKQSRQCVYVALGSTGNVDLLPTIVQVCRDIDAVCIVSTAGRQAPMAEPPNVYSEAFLPGGVAAAVADLVICNGGNPTASQALQQGTPVLGICSNLDQVLNMLAVQRVGAGRLMRAGEATPKRLRDAITEILQPASGCRSRAEETALEMAQFEPGRQLARLLVEQ